MHRERFAPSPTGPLHLGHAFSALTAWRAARQADGAFLLRIEDIDITRARPEWEAQIYDDLHWLGLDWPTPVWRQSDRMAQYAQVLQTLTARGLTYPCTCTRADISNALSAPQEGEPLGPVYPGTCRNGPQGSATQPAIRLNMKKALTKVGALRYSEIGAAPGLREVSASDLLHQIGDIVIARRDIETSYHIAVVTDDAAQQITHVTRGLDLEPATPLHVLLQHLLELPTPIYRHHLLIRDDAGKRLAKRDDARAISKYRADGASQDEVCAMVGLSAHG